MHVTFSEEKGIWRENIVFEPVWITLLKRKNDDLFIPKTKKIRYLE